MKNVHKDQKPLGEVMNLYKNTLHLTFNLYHSPTIKPKENEKWHAELVSQLDLTNVRENGKEDIHI